MLFILTFNCSKPFFKTTDGQNRSVNVQRPAKTAWHQASASKSRMLTVLSIPLQGWNAWFYKIQACSLYIEFWWFQNSKKWPTDHVYCTVYLKLQTKSFRLIWHVKDDMATRFCFVKTVKRCFIFYTLLFSQCVQRKKVNLKFRS
jgi:hypothetical protein